MIQNLAERTGSDDEMMRRFADKISSEISVCLPASVVSFNAEKQTIVAQPLIREKINIGGNVQFINRPQLVDIPVVFPQAGNFVLTMPIQPGDEVLLVFADTCIDAWLNSGGIQNWNDRRRHDLSDAIAIPGLNSIPNVIPNISTSAAELRTKDGSTKITVDDGTITLTGATVAINATTATISASEINLNGVIKNNGNAYLSHRHSGVQAGGSNTGGVVS